MLSCNDNENDETTSDNPVQTTVIFPDLADFPQQQFKTVELNTDRLAIIDRLKQMPVELIAEEEVAHFYFPADSTEIILPNATVINEFKVVLRSSLYLNETSELNGLFKENSTETRSDSTFSIYSYSTQRYDFKVSVFTQPQFIRLHYQLINSHS